MNSPKPKTIQIYVAIGTIIKEGTIEFDKNHSAPEMIKDSNVYFNGSLKKYDVGKTIKCMFSLRDKNRMLMTHEEIAPLGKHVQPVKIEKGNGRYIQPDVLQAFTFARGIASKKGICNLMLLGSSGLGKTSVTGWIAEMFDMNFHKVDCAMVRDSIEWYGSRELVGNNGATETKFVMNDFARLLQQGNAIFLLDEINRLESWITNGLFQLLEFGEVVVDGHKITLGKDIIFVATANVGYQYVATFAMDRALRNRFAITLVLKPMPEMEEISVLVERTGIPAAQAEKVVKIASRLRAKEDFDADVSHRTTLQVAELIAVGADIKQAYMLTVGNTLDGSNASEMANALNMPL